MYCTIGSDTVHSGLTGHGSGHKLVGLLGIVNTTISGYNLVVLLGIVNTTNSGYNLVGLLWDREYNQQRIQFGRPTP